MNIQRPWQEAVNKYGSPGFQTIQMSQKVSRETNGSYSMYKATEKGGRSVAAGNSNFSTNTKLPSLTWIRGLVNCLEGSSSQSLPANKNGAQALPSNMYQTLDRLLSTTLFHGSLLEFHHFLHSIAHRMLWQLFSIIYPNIVSSTFFTEGENPSKHVIVVPIFLGLLSLAVAAAAVSISNSFS